jgi:hypothetical protein
MKSMVFLRFRGKPFLFKHIAGYNELNKGSGRKSKREILIMSMICTWTAPQKLYQIK